MAMAADGGQHQASSFKCRKCRQFLFKSDSVLSLPSPGKVDDDSAVNLNAAALWYISDDTQPLWIQQAIKEAQWTRGKLVCPKCGGRLGSFDYLTPSIRHCQDHQGPWSCVQIISSRVDRETTQSVLANLGQGSRSHAYPSSARSLHGKLKGAASHSNYTADNVDDLAKGCWRLHRDKVDGQQLPSKPNNSTAHPMQVAHDNNQAKNNLEKYDEQDALLDADELSYLNCETSLDARSNICGCSKVKESELQSPPCINISALSSNTQLEGTQNECRQGHRYSEHLEKESLPSQANAVHERIQFGFFEREHDEHVRRHGCTHYVQDAVGDSSRQTVSRSELSVRSKLATGTSNVDAQPKLHAPVSSGHQGRYADTQCQTTTGHSHTAIESEQFPGVGTFSELADGSSPGLFQGFLDELLEELDQEMNRLPMATQTDRSNINLLEDEMDADNHQADEAIMTQVEIQDGSQGGMSTRLQRAVFRVQRRERNRRKGERRKLRKRERWREENEAREQELLVEVETLHSDPDKLVNLFGTCHASNTIHEALTCPVCLDIYFNPHLCLPCRHIFCEPCLRRLAHTLQTAMTIPCPLCRTVIQEAKLLNELMASIADMFPHINEQRKQAERKTLNKSYPLPGQTARTSLSTWISRTLTGRRANRQHHLRWRGGQARPTVGIFTHLAWQFGAVTLLMVSLVGLSAVFLSIMMNYL